MRVGQGPRGGVRRAGRGRAARVSAIYATFPNPGIRDAADPWVIAEAKVRGLTVVTYEGRSFAGVPTKRWARSMPGICQHEGVLCVTLPEALTALGGQF